jgi:hypothetical protein
MKGKKKNKSQLCPGKERLVKNTKTLTLHSTVALWLDGPGNSLIRL